MCKKIVTASNEGEFIEKERERKKNSDIKAVCHRLLPKSFLLPSYLMAVYPYATLRKFIKTRNTEYNGRLQN